MKNKQKAQQLADEIQALQAQAAKMNPLFAAPKIKQATEKQAELNQLLVGELHD